jgi:hypothetical protein
MARTTYMQPETLKSLANYLKKIIAKGESYNSNDVGKFLGIKDDRIIKMKDRLIKIIQNGYSKPNEILPKGIIYKNNKILNDPNYYSFSDFAKQLEFKEGKDPREIITKYKSSYNAYKPIFEKNLDTKQYGFINNKTGYTIQPLYRKPSLTNLNKFKEEFKKVKPRSYDENTNLIKNIAEEIKKINLPEKGIEVTNPIIDKLANKFNISKQTFLDKLSELRSESINYQRGINVSDNLLKKLNKFPLGKYVSQRLLEAGYSNRTVKLLRDVETAARVVKSGSQLEHSLAQSAVKEFNLPRKYLLTGERTTRFLNQFKKPFDNLIVSEAKKFAKIKNPSEQDYLNYKDKINNLRNIVAKKTGGYELGYVDFVDGKPVPVTSQKSILKGEGDLGPRTTGLKNYFKNIYYNNRLYENFTKNPNDPFFSTIKNEIKKNKYPFIKEVEAEKTYDLIKDLKTPEEFIDLYKKNPDNLFIKGLARTGVKSNLGLYISKLGKPAVITTGLLTAMTAALSAKEQPSSAQNTQTAMKDQTIENQPVVPQQQTTPITQVADASSAAKIADDLVYDDFRKVFVKRNEPEVKATQSDLLYWLADNPITESPIASIGVGTAALSIPGAKETFEAARKADKGILRSTASILGKGLTRVGSPAGTALFEVPFIAEQIQEGRSPYDILSDPLNYIGPAFTESLTRGAGAIKGPSKGFLGGVKDTLTFEGVRNPRKAAPGLLNLALRLGLSPRNIALISGTGAIGAIGASALTAYDLIDAYRKGELDNLFSSEETDGVDLSKGVSIPGTLDTSGIMGLKNET